MCKRVGGGKRGPRHCVCKALSLSEHLHVKWVLILIAEILILDQLDKAVVYNHWWYKYTKQSWWEWAGKIEGGRNQCFADQRVLIHGSLWLHWTASVIVFFYYYYYAHKQSGGVGGGRGRGEGIWEKHIACVSILKCWFGCLECLHLWTDRAIVCVLTITVRQQSWGEEQRGRKCFCAR